MQLEQTFTLQPPPARVWPAFKNIELLVDCLPGASLTGPAVDGDLPLRFDVKLGPIAAGFIGSGRVSFDDAAQAGRFEGQASDRRTGSRIRGAAAFALRPQEGATVVDVTVDYTLTGALAQFSRGAIVRDLAAALTSQFAAQLAARLLPAPDTATPPADTNSAVATSRAPDVPAAAIAPMPQALDAWSLLRSMLKLRWQALLHRWTGKASSRG
jgi:carbon monoxide dehydrogenase subunit G